MGLLKEWKEKENHEKGKKGRLCLACYSLDTVLSIPVSSGTGVLQGRFRTAEKCLWPSVPLPVVNILSPAHFCLWPSANISLQLWRADDFRVFYWSRLEDDVHSLALVALGWGSAPLTMAVKHMIESLRSGPVKEDEMRSIGYNTSAVSEMNHFNVYLWKSVLGLWGSILTTTHRCCVKSVFVVYSLLCHGVTRGDHRVTATRATQADRRTDRWTHATATFRWSSSAKCTVAIRCDAFLHCKSIFQQRRPTDDYLRAPTPSPHPLFPLINDSLECSPMTLLCRSQRH